MSRQEFSDLVTTVVINLDTRPGRWRRTRILCRLHGLEPRRFAAHDYQQGIRRFPEIEMPPGTLGLWSSFLDVLDSEFATEWIMILEDDVIPLPRFRHHVTTEIRRAGEDVLAIRLGWLGAFFWDLDKTFVGNCIKIVGATLRTLTSTKRSDLQLWGTHALVLRTRDLHRVRELLGPVDVPVDWAFLRAERDHPEAFQLARRNRAWQWPDRSDIQPPAGSSTT